MLYTFLGYSSWNMVEKRFNPPLEKQAAVVMFRLLIHPRPIARMQVIGYLERQPTHRGLFSMGFELEQEDADGKEGSPSF